MLQDPNVERYVTERLQPLQEQIKELQAEVFKLMQAKNLHLQNVIRQSDPLFCPKCNSTQRIDNDNDANYTCSRCGTRWAK